MTDGNTKTRIVKVALLVSGEVTNTEFRHVLDLAFEDVDWIRAYWEAGTEVPEDFLAERTLLGLEQALKDA